MKNNSFPSFFAYSVKEQKMAIDFQTISGSKNNPSTDVLALDSREGSKALSEKRGANISGSYVAKLQSSFFNNDVYGKHSRTAENISEMAGNTDVWIRHNYMALLSNTMSEEDFAKAAEDGFDIKDLDSEDTVTIMDRIKSVLLEAGTTIAGFNDDIDVDKLAKITGSRSFAEQLTKSFTENDIPVTGDLVRSAKIAYEEVADIEALDDATLKYMVQNSMDPTIENIYFASHSTNGQNVSGRGFYAQDTGGYYAQKADTYDWSQLESQLEKIIEESGLNSNDEQVKDEAKWLIQQGVPLTAESLETLDNLKSISFPISEELAAKAIAAAFADSKKAVQADLYDPRSDYTKAYDIKNQAEKITVDGIRTTLQSGKEINLKNLYEQTNENKENPQNIENCIIDSTDKRVVQTRLQLEEIRFQMTVEANRNLLRSGFSIDTSPIRDVVDRLRNLLNQIPDETMGNALDEITEITPDNKTYIFRTTISRVNIIKNGPIEISGYMLEGLESSSLSEISETSVKLSTAYSKAGKEYETFMTAPRADLGDSIKKAFRNVDDILQDLQLEKNDDNRRAIRILGYNSMEINKDNFEEVRAWDQMLKATIDRLKPGAVLNLIREGKNPLGMTIEELAQNLDNSSSEQESRGNKNHSDEKYSKFLYKLEHSGEISKEEKTSFIGIYRLFHTLKVGDYQAIGSLLKTGREMTLGNLLTATRTKKAAGRGMDITVDDSFGGFETKADSSNIKIDEQIGSAFRFYSAKADIVYENLEPEKLAKVKTQEETLLPDLADELQRQDIDKALEQQYYSEETRHIREVTSQKEAEQAILELDALENEITFNNLEAMILNRRSRRTGDVWKNAEDSARDAVKTQEDVLVDALDQDGYEETYKSSIDAMSDSLETILMKEESFVDVRAISLIKKQLSVMRMAADRETFEVPVDIDGQKVSMHITIKSEDGKDPRMEASIQTYEFGTITASLTEKNGMVSGMLMTTNSQSIDETEYLESIRTKMCDKLAEKLKNIGVNRDEIAILYHAHTSPISVGAAKADATDGDRPKKIETKDLLTMAKAFIEAL